MNIKELKDFFANSAYSNDTKSIINGILMETTEVTPGLISQVKDVLQKELDVDFQELGVDAENDPELQKIEQEYVEALDNIENDLNSDMGFVEKELKELEEIRKKVIRSSDDVEAVQMADKLKQSM